MSVKPILFNTEMVQAILDGRKTVTRRVIKPQPIHEDGFWKLGGAAWSDNINNLIPISCHSLYNRLPYKPGDILYVRETWKKCNVKILKITEEGGLKYEGVTHTGYYYEVPDNVSPTRVAEMTFLDGFNIDDLEDGYTASLDDISEHSCWKPSIHMPKEAARIWLKVTDVMVKRLQDIYASDTSKEGVFFDRPHTADEMIDKFAKLWNSTIKKQDLDKYGWNANPWVCS